MRHRIRSGMAAANPSLRTPVIHLAGASRYSSITDFEVELSCFGCICQSWWCVACQGAGWRQGSTSAAYRSHPSQSPHHLPSGVLADATSPLPFATPCPCPLFDEHCSQSLITHQTWRRTCRCLFPRGHLRRLLKRTRRSLWDSVSMANCRQAARATMRTRSRPCQRRSPPGSLRPLRLATPSHSARHPRCCIRPPAQPFHTRREGRAATPTMWTALIPRVTRSTFSPLRTHQDVLR